MCLFVSAHVCFLVRVCMSVHVLFGTCYVCVYVHVFFNVYACVSWSFSTEPFHGWLGPTRPTRVRAAQYSLPIASGPPV